jgi:hypothetical protein
MFLEAPDLAPISMIITNLAARSYEGETELGIALAKIIEMMPSFVRPTRPRVPNPAAPGEDYADKWAADPQLERSFWDWHTAVKADIRKLSSLAVRSTLRSTVQQLFMVDLTQKETRQLVIEESSASAPVKTSPVLTIRSAPRPWGCDV